MFVFGDFSSKVKLKPKEVYPDNITFRLHYRLTFWFLLACSVLVSSRQFINSHINCLSGFKDDQNKVINTFCFFSSTFTVNKYHNKSFYEKDIVAHPGVGPYRDEPIVYHTYYQWVPFVLFLQALMFAAPHKLWKSYDNKRLENIVTYMRTSRLTADTKTVIQNQVIDSLDSREEKIQWLNTKVATWSRFKINRDWGLKLFLCEFLNFCNLVLQFWLLNKFFQGKFLELGYDWWYFEEEALEEIFPKVTKCTFYKYGSSGSLQKHDALCVMALNIINEKIFCIIWFWFMILLIVTIAGLAWRVTTFLCHSSFMFNRWIWGEISPGPALPRKEIDIIGRSLFFSDWLFLYYLGKNMRANVFRKMVSQLTKEIEQERHPKQILEPLKGEYSLGSESSC